MLFYRFGVVENVDALAVGHQYHKIERTLMQQACGGLGTVGQREARRIAQIQRVIFVENLLIDAAVLLQRKRVVVARHKQHIVDTPIHQVRKRCVLEIEPADVWCVVHRHKGTKIVRKYESGKVKSV